MVTGTNIFSSGDGARSFDLWGIGLVVIVAFFVISGIKNKNLFASLLSMVGCLIPFMSFGLIAAAVFAVLGGAIDSWENERATEEGREVRLYNGDTAPVEDNPDTEIPEHVYYPEGQ